ncbi:hypothetical protein ACEZDB_12095 [Streptacidiphilus sp. N1-3]|uniref:receptor protein-tyrosine kinase n=1 Tax=Streptacidiphilus alkalitolerans TaxID=3342712 RepID=A0ABV6WZH3_9ACTN
MTQLSVTAIGATGGGYVESLWPYIKAPNSGGTGAKVTATLKVTPDQQLYVNVAAPAVNGDGDGMGPLWRWRMPVGGGASDIRTSATAALTGAPGSDPRLVVAAGGGSVGGEGYQPGGNAGAVPSAGTNSEYGACGGGAATATAAGAGGTGIGCPSGNAGDNPFTGGSGTAGAGGAPAIDTNCEDGTNRPAGGMGGSGWFGGGGGGTSDYCDGGGGGAGSSYTSAALASAVTVAADTARDTPQVTITYTNPIVGSPVFDAGGSYAWSNGSTLDFPTALSIPSPQGTHQRSCSTLGGYHDAISIADQSFVTLQPWNYSSGATSWRQSGAGIAHLRLTTDGNLQFVTGTQVWWSSNTAPHPGLAYYVTLKLQTDGNLALYGPQGQYLWDAKVAPVCP